MQIDGKERDETLFQQTTKMKPILNPERVEEFKRLIEKHDNIVLTCHMRPDGDAIGSTLGLCHLLRKLGKQANVVVPDRLPRSLMFLPGVKDIAVNSQYDPYCARLVNEAGLIIMCDFNTAKRQGDLAQVITDAKCDKVLIDHHKDPDLDCNVSFSYPEMSSTCELVFRLIAALGYYGELNSDAATCILTGILTDTQNFSVNCNDPELYDILTKLLEKNVDRKKIVDEALKSKTLDALRLMSFAILERLEIIEQHHCGLVTLSKADLERFNYEKGDTEGLVNEPLRIPEVAYSVFLREDSDCIKVSCRSKDNFPVSEICKDLFGGGGHLMAAGGEFHGTLDECRKVLFEHMKDYDKYLPQRFQHSANGGNKKTKK